MPRIRTYVSEASFKAAVVRRIKRYGDKLWYQVNVERGSRRGLPDLIICCDGGFVGAELKLRPPTPSQKRAALQEEVRRRIRAAGGSAFLLTPINVEDFFDFINKKLEVLYD